MLLVQSRAHRVPIPSRDSFKHTRSWLRIACKKAQRTVHLNARRPRSGATSLRMGTSSRQVCILRTQCAWLTVCELRTVRVLNMSALMPHARPTSFSVHRGVARFAQASFVRHLCSCYGAGIRCVKDNALQRDVHRSAKSSALDFRQASTTGCSQSQACAVGVTVVAVTEEFVQSVTFSAWTQQH